MSDSFSHRNSLFGNSRRLFRRSAPRPSGPTSQNPAIGDNVDRDRALPTPHIPVPNPPAPRVGSRNGPIFGRSAPRPSGPTSQNPAIGDNVDRDRTSPIPIPPRAPTFPRVGSRNGPIFGRSAPRPSGPTHQHRGEADLNYDGMLRRLADIESAIEQNDTAMERNRRAVEQHVLRQHEVRHSRDGLMAPRFPLEANERQARNQARVAAGQGSVAAVLPRAERERVIRELRKENENPAPPMSRACRICFVDSPLRRAVFTACGHASCNACALRLAGVASDEGKALACPFCRAETGFVPLFEDPIGDSEN